MLNYQKQQAEFAAFIRNPDKNTVSDQRIEPRRLKIYSELFFNNIEGFLSSGFPVLKSLMTEAQWLTMARDFFENYQCHSPYFLEISEEFLQYLQDDSRPIYTALPEIKPFMQELAHYEWLELAVDVNEAEFQAENGEALLAENLQVSAVVSELAVVAAYQWPVHKICSDFIPTQPAGQPVCLLVYRNRGDDVEFLESNAATFRLLELLKPQRGDEKMTVAAAIETFAGELQQPLENITAFAVDLLNQLHQLDIISHFE
ncbi:MAG: putative DNA-binding domain-containing protein [Pseudomonadales bacterium]|nr:putative DNA-binding domain-containing protein [Pseudomonadales bacterium]